MLWPGFSSSFAESDVGRFAASSRSCCFFFNLAICDSALAISLSTLEIFWSRSSLVLLTSSLSAVLSSGVGLIAST